ncbi:succinate dehydrogenase cytochrome b subunit [Winogradskyella sp. PAMC22761]|nr:succinate dehydrogenase cytochrome b subunit [Winogradskyella sp. PAMC22761]
MSGILNSSIGRKIAMALSALFLIFFLIIHLAVNITSVFSADLFNELSHFMGTNPLVQFALQPVLVFGVIFHFVLGFVLEVRNRKAVGNISYKKNNGAANSSWMSRNMIYSGLAILAFIVLHFIDFWVPEINHKYIEVLPEDPTRYFGELQHKFVPIWRVIAYVVAFIFLSLHLMHGFTSSLQSMGVASSRKKFFKNFGLAYSIIIPLGFVIVALFHHFNH